MKRKTSAIVSFVCAVSLCAAVIAPQAMAAQNASPKYKAEVPEAILTPAKVETKLLGNFEFFDGMPNKATVGPPANWLSAYSQSKA